MIFVRFYKSFIEIFGKKRLKFCSARETKSRYKILIDQITYLVIFDNISKEQLLRRPSDLVCGHEYKDFSKEDILRIGFICGQSNQRAD